MPLPRAIVPLSEFTESNNVMLYGHSNAGKTTLAGQIEDNLILATEQGTVSAARSDTHASNVAVWPINKWNDLEEAFLFCKNENANERKPFKWVTIDSATNMQQMLIRNILQIANENNPAKYDLDIPQIQDYQKWQNKFKRFINSFNDLPMNTLWTAQTMELENADGDEEILPFIQGKKGEISRWVCAQMHIVAYYGKKVDKAKKNDDGTATKASTRRRLLFDEANGRFAKDRYGVFGKFVDITVDDEQLNNFGELMSRVEGPAEKTASKKSGKVSLPPPVEEDDDEDDIEDDVEEETPEPETATKETKTRKFRAVPNDEDDD